MPINIWGDFVPHNVSGCQHCEYSKEVHGVCWSDGAWHEYTPPTKEQRYTRIRANASDRKAAKQGKAPNQ